MVLIRPTQEHTRFGKTNMAAYGSTTKSLQTSQLCEAVLRHSGAYSDNVYMLMCSRYNVYNVFHVIRAAEGGGTVISFACI